jgi:hypothetical protein
VSVPLGTARSFIMAWIKARARDLFFFAVFAVMLFNCSYQKPSCKGLVPDRTLAPDAEATMPAHDELREMACACAAAPELGDDCAEDLWESRKVVDDAGCGAEHDDLLSCVEDGDACSDGGEWACDAAEIAWRACVGARSVTEPRELAAERPAAR